MTLAARHPRAEGTHATFPSPCIPGTSVQRLGVAVSAWFRCGGRGLALIRRSDPPFPLPQADFGRAPPAMSAAAFGPDTDCRAQTGRTAAPVPGQPAIPDPDVTGPPLQCPERMPDPRPGPGGQAVHMRVNGVRLAAPGGRAHHAPEPAGTGEGLGAGGAGTGPVRPERCLVAVRQRLPYPAVVHPGRGALQAVHEAALGVGPPCAFMPKCQSLPLLAPPPAERACPPRSSSSPLRRWSSHPPACPSAASGLPGQMRVHPRGDRLGQCPAFREPALARRQPRKPAHHIALVKDLLRHRVARRIALLQAGEAQHHLQRHRRARALAAICGQCGAIGAGRRERGATASTSAGSFSRRVTFSFWAWAREAWAREGNVFFPGTGRIRRRSGRTSQINHRCRTPSHGPFLARAAECAVARPAHADRSSCCSFAKWLSSATFRQSSSIRKLSRIPPRELADRKASNRGQTAIAVSVSGSEPCA